MDNNFGRHVVKRTGYAREGVDAGLRTFMLSVYNYMTLGLTLTGVVAFFVFSSPTLLKVIFGTPLYWVVALAPIGFVFYLSYKIQSISAARAQTLFWIYSGVMGLSLASIFMVYTGVSVAKVFFITAATFASTSFYGYVTKRDLSGFGSFLFMGLIGIIIASLVNIFLQSSALEFMISIIGVGVFVGLTAYDTQMIKNLYAESDSKEVATKKAVIGALHLYLDFINMFLMLLRLLGNRR